MGTEPTNPWNEKKMCDNLQLFDWTSMHTDRSENEHEHEHCKV